MKKMKLAATAVMGLLLLATVGASPASADVTYNLDVCHITDGCATSPWGDVVLSQNGANVNVVVNLFNGNSFLKSGAGDGFAFKFVGLPNGSSTTILSSDITITSPAVPGLTVEGPGSFDGDGTGLYAFGITCPTCGNGAGAKFSGPIDFTVANASISELTIANASGFFFTADIFEQATGKTGPVAADGPSTVPDGGVTLMLLGGALVGLEGLRRRFRV